MSDWIEKVLASKAFFRSPSIEDPRLSSLSSEREHSRNAGQVLATEIDKLQSKLSIARAALELAKPTMIWFHDGPYGPSPGKDDLAKFLQALKEIGE